MQPLALVSAELVATIIAVADGFSGWQSLNDTVMGGRSQGSCTVSSSGLLMEANVVAEGGGFISCRSPRWQPPLDLSAASAFVLELEGDGRRYKLAVAVADLAGQLGEMIPGGLRWVSDFSTEDSGSTRVVIPFRDLRPVLRAKPVSLPLRFDPAQVNRLQILHSRFADDGGQNPGFRAGPLRLEIQRIEAVE
ncbi:MAG: epimerase [Synechococcus sp. TMED19]|nr:MAG: epimerase [Synechococcus sp. TMED19]